MDTHEISRDKPKPSGEAATMPTAASAADVSATPRMALAGIPLPAVETPAAEAPPIGLARVEAPNITPDIEEPKPPAGEAAAEKATDEAAAAAEPPAEAAAPRISRFTLLAATLALAAALGGMAGALVAYGLARPGPAPAAARTDVDEIQALKENVLQTRVDLAALKVSIESAGRSASAQFTRIGERIDRIDRAQGEPATKLNKAIEALERLSREAAAQSKEVTGALAGAPGKPGAVAGWVVRDVRHGTALIEGRMGLIEVEQGDFVPGLGRVDAIRKQDGRWVVVTAKGVITPPR
ncbi:MAG TPA: hypothetical protein VH397_17580 [Xanthobacteraceae bacterium]